MSLLERFLDPATVSLKICGVTLPADAEELVTLGVDALGVNFWPHSKRHVAPGAAGWLADLTGRILRVGVFVNESPQRMLELFEKGWIDVIQLHGDETAETIDPIRSSGAPFIKALGVRTATDLQHAGRFGADALLLDAPAPGTYGGTGQVFDWSVAAAFRTQNPALPVILAGGIVPENARLAIETVRPAALDVASGAESSPGIKDLTKVAAFLTALNR